MASLNEITHNVRNALSGGSPTTDTPVSARQIAFAVRYYRELLIRRDTDFYKRSKEYEQSLGLLSMSVVHQDVGKYKERPHAILRSNRELPKRIHLRKRRPLTSITSPDLGQAYTVTQPATARYQQYNKYTADVPRSFVQDDHLYITSDEVAQLINDLEDGSKDFEETSTDDLDEGITTVRVEGVFSNPIVVYQFREDRPYNPDEEYPATPEDLIQRITQSILKGEGRVLQKAPFDTESDHLPVNSEPADNEAAQ